MLELALSENPLETAIGIATANALSHMLRDLEPENFPVSDVDVLDLIKPEDQSCNGRLFRSSRTKNPENNR